MVFHSFDATFEERIQAWKWIIDNMPDCAVKERPNLTPMPSFHQFLKEYITLQKQKLEHFYAKDNSVYFYRYTERSHENESNYDQAFSSAEKCIEACKKGIEKIFSDNMGELLSVQIKKQWLDAPEEYEKYVELFMNNEMQILFAEERSESIAPQEIEVDTAFEGMWFSFPTPFCSGDIVCEERCGGKEVFVLNYIDTWTEKDMLERGVHNWERFLKNADQRVERLIKQGDRTDMCARGHQVVGASLNKCSSVNACNVFYDVCSCDYLALRHYNEPLKNEADHMLYAVGKFIKSEFDIAKFIDAYTVLRAQYHIKSISTKYLPSWAEELEIEISEEK